MLFCGILSIFLISTLNSICHSMYGKINKYQIPANPLLPFSQPQYMKLRVRLKANLKYFYFSSLTLCVFLLSYTLEIEKISTKTYNNRQHVMWVWVKSKAKKANNTLLLLLLASTFNNRRMSTRWCDQLFNEIVSVFCHSIS